MSEAPSFWNVAVDAPLPSALTYELPQIENEELGRGVPVRVPLGGRQVNGVLIEPTKQIPSFQTKSIQSRHQERPRLKDPFLAWLEWLAKYYAHPIGQVLELAFPPLKKQGRVLKKNPIVAKTESTLPPTLTDEQENVVSAILASTGFNTHLVFGVTGSGKTEIYLRLLEKVLASGQQAIVLVPEISLTPQLVARFASRFGDQIAVIHSHLTEREKTNQWWQVVEEKKQILIGARSALFCPAPKLGLIVVDEEHEASFKQEEMLKYHARDAAIMLAKLSGCPIVLGSATPSLESWKNALDGKYILHRLKKRVENRPLPKIEVVDLRQERAAHKDSGQISEIPFWLSQNLYGRVSATLSRNQQVALLLNRRGVGSMVLCEACGAGFECPNCAVHLTLHAKTHLVCHYCGYHENLKEVCPHCKVGEPKVLGVGTEKIEEDLKELFPQKKVARADRDEIQSREDLESLIERFEKREIDILIGTQMIAKGLDFPGLNLVGLILADVGFNIPDFRSTERSFQLLTQMSGRAGRHVNEGERGEVIIQTYNPQHPGIMFTMQNNYEAFVAQELAFRQELFYPPYAKLAAIRVQGANRNQTERLARQLAQYATRLKQSVESAAVGILGPAEAPLSRLRGKFRFQLLLKASDPTLLNWFARCILEWSGPNAKGCRVQIDIDPYSLM